MFLQTSNYKKLEIFNQTSKRYMTHYFSGKFQCLRKMRKQAGEIGKPNFYTELN